MRTAVMNHVDKAGIIIKSAAVADYQVTNVPKQKMKKTAARMSLELDPTPDILAEVGQRKGDRLLIGFAAETQNLVEEARRKMTTKNCDMIVANAVNREGVGFGADENEVVLVMRTGEIVELPRASKRSIADSIFDRALRLRLSLHASAV
jgi:phosphopantothenoylcysteine decarboxylase/phosphopantothenate--cysteine ligase